MVARTRSTDAPTEKSPTRYATHSKQSPHKPEVGQIHRIRNRNDVFWYLPQLIGYSRVICTLLSVYFAVLSLGNGSFYIRSITLYCMSFLGDLFDGIAARKMNQTSTFGGVLDMVTDRCTTLGMLVILTWIYDEPMHRIGLTYLAFLDISSHWFQMYAAAALRQHHKSSEANVRKIFIVRLFYSSYPFFAYCCVGCEFTYIFLYIIAYCENARHVEIILPWLYYFCIPACVLKNIVNVFQLASASAAIAEYDVNVYNENNNKKK